MTETFLFDISIARRVFFVYINPVFFLKRVDGNRRRKQEALQRVAASGEEMVLLRLGLDAYPSQPRVSPVPFYLISPTSMLMSSALTLWVSAPTEMTSTPDFATASIVSSLMPPEASTMAR